MARGVDIWAAEIVLKKKRSNPKIKLICALPHEGFEKRRTEYEKFTFYRILKKADSVKLVSERYFNGCYQVRNKWMVDSSECVIAVFNGEKGGTKNTIDYAVQRNKTVINII